MVKDEQLVRELSLHSDNDARIYNSRVVPTIKNYARKQDRGVFEKERAIDGIRNNIVPDVVASYNREYGTNFRLNKEEKDALAREIYDSMKDEIKDNRKVQSSSNSGSVSVVRGHARKGTKGVKAHTRNTTSKDLI